jgi:hypothetical protein
LPSQIEYVFIPAHFNSFLIVLLVSFIESHGTGRSTL